MKFGHEVLKLLALYRRVQERLDRAGFKEFNLQFLLVEALARVAVLRVVREGEQEGGAE